MLTVKAKDAATAAEFKRESHLRNLEKPFYLENGCLISPEGMVSINPLTGKVDKSSLVKYEDLSAEAVLMLSDYDKEMCVKFYGAKFKNYGKSNK
jgi:hypothetical protein